MVEQINGPCFLGHPEFSKARPNVIGNSLSSHLKISTSYVKLFLRVKESSYHKDRGLQSKAEQQEIEAVRVILEIEVVMVIVQEDKQEGDLLLL